MYIVAHLHLQATNAAVQALGSRAGWRPCDTLRVFNTPIATWAYTRDAPAAKSPGTSTVQRGIVRRPAKTPQTARHTTGAPQPPGSSVFRNTVATRYHHWVAQRAFHVDVSVLCVRLLALLMLWCAPHAAGIATRPPWWIITPLLCVLLAALLPAALVPRAYQRHRWWLLPVHSVAVGACSALLLAPWLLGIGDTAAVTLARALCLETALCNALLTVR